MVVGQFSYVYTGPGTYIERSGIVRFHSDGSVDESFNPGTGAQVSGDSPIVQFVGAQRLASNAGKLILFGYFDSFDGHPVDGTVRIGNSVVVQQRIGQPL